MLNVKECMNNAYGEEEMLEVLSAVFTAYEDSDDGGEVIDKRLKETVSHSNLERNGKPYRVER